MAAQKMHTDEVDVDAGLVRRLLASQVPEWAGLSVEPVRFFGTDNAIYRLGNAMAVRLPRRQKNVAQLQKERRWLPRLAPFLPLAVPVPLAVGKPGEGYPFEWAVYLMVAWKVLSVDTRDSFRTALAVDDATWARGRGWALSQALIALAYYTLDTNPVLVREARRWMAETLTDHR